MCIRDRVYLISGLCLLALALWQPPQLWPLMVPLFICVASLGCVLPLSLIHI